MNIHVIGAGAIGKLFASKLAEINEPLLVTRTGEQASLIRSGGLILQEETDRFQAAVRCADARSYADDVSSGRIGKADCLLLTVKQPHIDPSLVRLLANALKPEGLVVCLQNGIGHTDLLSNCLGSERVAIAVTTEGARDLSPLAVHHTGKGRTKLGMAASQGSFVAEERLRAVVHCLEEAGFVAELSNEITIDVWNKLVINSVINPLTAIYGLLNGELLASPFLLRIMRSLFDEAVAVARLEGVRTDPHLWELLLEVCRRTAGNRSSMLQDVEAGRPTEVEWINGSLLRAARRHGLLLPAQDTVYRAISGSEHSR